jgi:hypothetical protein
VTRRPHGAPSDRETVYCVSCHAKLAFVRPEWLVLRRLLVTEAAVAHKREASLIYVTCRCGSTTTVQWAMIQF